eukprot:5894491-Prymnesium_polylepis.4
MVLHGPCSHGHTAHPAPTLRRGDASRRLARPSRPPSSPAPRRTIGSPGPSCVRVACEGHGRRSLESDSQYARRRARRPPASRSAVTQRVTIKAWCLLGTERSGLNGVNLQSYA